MIKEELQAYIEEGRHGVTKHQMIAAVNAHYKNEDAIRALYNEYPNTFKTALRYCKKASRDACMKIFNGDISKVSQEEFLFINNELKPGRKGVSMSQIIDYVEHAVEEGNWENVAKAKHFFPEYYERSTRYIKKPIHEKINAMFAVMSASNKAEM